MGSSSCSARLTANRTTPPSFVTAAPNWNVGEVITFSNAERARVVAIESTDEPDLVKHEIRAIFTVAPLED